tara:strand:- start:26 stop:475 length:450 start_codon:yes stop_codon:yes gene_type:complete
MTQTPVTFEDGTTLKERIAEWTNTYADTITSNYKVYHRRSLESMTSEYSKKQLEELKNGTANLMRFVVRTGKKYYKIIQQDFDTFRDRNEYRDGSVHAFVDKNTGEVYKPASWKSPAKHVRYDLRIINDRVNLHDPHFTSWAGGYLYLR